MKSRQRVGRAAAGQSLGNLVSAVRAAIRRRASWAETAGLAPPGDIHRVRNSDTETAISVHIYGTDIGRLGSGVRRSYDLPVVAGLPG